MRSDLLDDSIALEFSCRGSLIGLDLSVELIPEVMAVLTRAQEHFRRLDKSPALDRT